MSNGLVDGMLHEVPGKKTQDRAIRCIKDDRTVSRDILSQFLSTFPVQVMRLNDIAALGYNPASFKLCKLMTFIKPTSPIPRDFLNDFLTTIRYPLVSHKEMHQLPSTKTSHSFPINQFHDSPTMTCGLELRFCSRVSEQQYITSFPQGRLLRHVNGTVLLDSNGILIGARCSKSLHSTFTDELLLVYNQMELYRPYLLRGKEVTNVCANFVVTGLKEDLNTKLKMTHTAKSERSAHLDMEMRAKLRGIFIKHIYPIVVQEFGWLFEPVGSWLEEQDVKLFARFVSGVTAGRLFWPRSHKDPDVWFTVLVCIDYGDGIKGGGDFGFGSIGVNSAEVVIPPNFLGPISPTDNNGLSAVNSAELVIPPNFLGPISPTDNNGLSAVNSAELVIPPNFLGPISPTDNDGLSAVNSAELVIPPNFLGPISPTDRLRTIWS
jgi:hypothetical protein